MSDRCECGWLLPARMVRSYEADCQKLVEAAKVRVELTCPVCEREHEVHWLADESVAVFKA